MRNFIGEIFGFNAEIDGLWLEIQKLKMAKGDLEISIQNKERRIKQLQDEFNVCNKKLSELLEKIKPVEIPSADITYRRPVLIGERKFTQVEIDVRNFIMPDFEIERNLKKKSLLYTGKENLDFLIPKIYKQARTGYKYGPDSAFGFSDLWMFPFELRMVLKKKKAGDCDDWANMIGSYFAAANIPRNRWLISAGLTRNEIGHATVYVKDSVEVWRHLNSTKPSYKEEDLKKFPSNEDEADKIGIKPDGFWFSYNDIFSLHKFESRSASSSFRKSKLPIKIRGTLDGE